MVRGQKSCIKLVEKDSKKYKIIDAKIDAFFVSMNRFSKFLDLESLKSSNSSFSALKISISNHIGDKR